MSHSLALLDHVATPVFVLEIDDEGVPRYAAFNRTALDAAGFTLDNILGRTACEVYPGPMGARAYLKHLEVLRTGHQMTYEIALPLASGLRQIRTTLDPVRDLEGRIVQLVGTSVDLTALQGARESQASLHTITQEIEEFVALAAHDLRAPLRNVRLLADMIREGFVDHGDGKLDLLDMIEDVALRSNLLISDILSYARSVDSEPQRETFEFDSLCEALRATLDPAGAHEINWMSRLLTTDRTACHIALRNLLDNAIKHAQTPCVALEIGVREISTDWLEFRVRDNGRGFEDPAQAFLETGELKINSGYGLFGVKRMLIARGGMIRAENRSDAQGGEVIFTLPGHLGPARPVRDPLGALTVTHQPATSFRQ